MHVELNGLYTEGIYRKSGSTCRARELYQILETGKKFLAHQLKLILHKILSQGPIKSTQLQSADRLEFHIQLFFLCYQLASLVLSKNS